MGDWKTQYVTEDRENEVELCVRNPNGISWFWSAYDHREENLICVSVLPGFDSKEAAMEVAENWYATEWLPKFKETGDREG